MPSNLVKFFREVSKAATAAAWEKLLAKGWAIQPSEQPKVGSKRKNRPVLTGPGRSRNPVLADLLSVYAEGFIHLRRARLFIRRHLLAERRGSIAHPGDCDWALTDLFLKEVLGMSPDRVERIKVFADALAQHIARKNDKSFFRALIFSQRPGEFRNAFVKAQRNEYLDRCKLLFNFDEYIQVFEAEDNAGFADWSLVRDLISIRLIETLHNTGWLTPDELASEVAKEAQPESERVGA